MRQIDTLPVKERARRVAFGQWLSAERTEAGVSAAALARFVGTTPAYIFGVECGANPIPTEERLMRFAVGLKIPVAEMFVRAQRIPPQVLEWAASNVDVMELLIAAARAKPTAAMLNAMASAAQVPEVSHG